MFANWMANHVPVIKLPMLKGWAGFATPFFIAVNDRDNVKLIKHEQAHVYQWWRGWIVGFALYYLYELATKGYKQNMFEVLANKYARDETNTEDTWPI